MEILDEDGKGTGKGYNDWRRATFVEDKDGDTAQFHMAMRDMNVKIGERYSMEVEEGSYGAYMISDPKEPLYIVRWEGEPWQAESDGSREVSNVEYKWTKGDWMCRGTWLQRLPGGGRNWYTMDSGGRSCIVPLDRVVNADLDMRPFTDRQGDNPLPSVAPLNSVNYGFSSPYSYFSKSDFNKF